MNNRKSIHLLILGALCVTLINTRMFVQPTLVAFFFFSIITCVTAITVGAGLLLKKHTSFSYPVHLALLHAMGVYIALHGLITHSWNIISNYWLAAILYYTCVHIIYEKRNTGQEANSILIKGIVWIGFAEGLIVLMQAIRIIPSWSSALIATGTWSNPNVTAIYLAISLHFFFYAISLASKKRALVVMTVVVMIALLLLRCRTAFLVALSAIGMHYWPALQHWRSSVKSVLTKVAVSLLVLAAFVFMIAVFVNMKDGSASGRMLIYKNSLAMVLNQPWKGSGFGLFEKAYNLYVVEHGFRSGGYINIAYNDFIEIWAEGGLVALILWSAFLITYSLWAFRRKYSLFPVMALVIIQSVNFAFQAAPVFALLLMSMACPLPVNARHKQVSKTSVPGETQFLFPKNIVILGMLLALMIGISQIKVTKALHQLNEITASKGTTYISKLKQLETTLNDQTCFHEKFGDAWLAKGNPQKANEEYRKALETSARPPVLVKYGYSFQVQNNYDSSLYYYRIAQKIEPFKFITRLIILRMYEQKRDTLNIKAEAEDILNMPVKIESDRVDHIKQYAQNILSKIK
ncbi:O-antigen ligase family protein [Filimonas effusa]|uniref:O-antigen ligase domain-containing protein n=1 Tax=Filimonas effusa TaxID=2508721 RepID=A0A4Q1D9J3_9BACT|nr:O-antigen ligase family protein [Filimonas effusa]RXK86052.1 O-antigen ligase domain-containing protein [Filimonas effusa]